MVERRHGLRSLAGRRLGVLAPKGWRDLAAQVGLLGSFEVAYALSGLYGRHEAAQAVSNAHGLLGLERSLGLAWEHGVQGWVLHGPHILLDGTGHESITALGDPFTPRDVETWMAHVLARSSAVVCGSQWRDDFPPDTLAALAGNGRTVYLDGQGAARPRRLRPVRLEGPLDPTTVAAVQVLKLGEEEAAALIGGIDPAAALTIGVPVVVVTRAAEASNGATPVEATRRACAGVAKLLRARLSGERAAAALAAAVDG